MILSIEEKNLEYNEVDGYLEEMPHLESHHFRRIGGVSAQLSLR